MKEISIKDVPMVTDDQHEIRLNDVLYTAEWTTGYDFKKEGKFKIEAHRVISVNNSARHFRTRCMNGCETSHEFSKGCSRQRLYGDIESAKKYAEERMIEDQKKCDEKIARAKATRVYIEDQKKALASVKTPRVPKPVKVS